MRLRQGKSESDLFSPSVLVKVEAGWVCLVDAGRWSGLEDLSEVRDVVRFLGCRKRASWLQTQRRTTG